MSTTRSNYFYTTKGGKSTGVGMIFAEHMGQWKKILHLAINHLKSTYKGALLGPAWAIVKPSFTLFILWFAFAVGLRGSGTVNGYPRFFFMLTGYVPWFYISDAILNGARSIRHNKQYVTKLSFPMSNIMTFTNLSSLFIHFILVAIMYIVLIIKGFAPSIYNLQFFFYCPLMFLFFWILSWTTAPMAAFSKDFENLVSSIMTGLFWLSGIVWDTVKVKNPIIRKSLYLNPINYFINGYRRTFLYGQPLIDKENLLETAIMFGEMIILILIGSHFYRKLRKLIPDVL
ncbi:teichoic acid transport system permease protein [Ruminococcus sp. YE71]|uniref:ABC transporter permease n=1 Tax=unclassified Ruminococcus TaxID=2608920 RepID=UPI000888F328|nr:MULTISPECIES: ABC transporter permease [unclassified Ruminococcus]SDA21640.1 teichoic acid transport system permease protein [Ruminococcus sp. YE78]SFW36581.1 teichoic acid transport system permease protein [Ruminococcus sp. YE71]